MNHIQVPDSLVELITGKKAPTKVEDKKLTESKKEEVKPVEKTEKVEEAVEEHICPLCETKLAEPLSDEKLQEHVEKVLSIIDEVTEGEDGEDGEDLDEDTQTEGEDTEDGDAK